MPMVRINEPIATWEDGDFAQGFALVLRKEIRQDRKGRDYADLELADASGSVGAKIWPDSPAIKGHFSEKSFVAFKGTVRLFKDHLQLNLDLCRTVEAADRDQGFDEKSLIPTTPENIDLLKVRLATIFPEMLRRPALRSLAAEALRRFGAELEEHPAAKSIHHAYRGGLLEHVVSMSELAVKICEQYTDVDRDLVLLGVLFHDLGKLREIKPMPANDYTLEGQLVGHIALGQKMLQECCATVSELKPQLILHLEHLIASHHGRREWGSTIEPATLEAVVLHLIDNLDSKVNQLRQLRRAHGDGLQYQRTSGATFFFDPTLRDA
jgi:3'-5' exoribonuclease